MKQRKFFSFLFSLLFIQSLFSSNTSINIDTEGDKTVSIEGLINPISGDYVIDEIDHVIPGVEPIVLRRVYSSGMQRGKEARWIFMPHTVLTIDPKVYGDKERRIFVCEPSGMGITYKNYVCEKQNGSGKDRYQFVPILGEKAKGITNNSKGYIGGKTNIKNNSIQWVRHEDLYILTSCDGTKRYYKIEGKKDRALLQKERRPNGNWIFYQHIPGTTLLSCIYTTDPHQSKVYAKVTFQNEDVPAPFKDSNRLKENHAARGSDGSCTSYIYYINNEKEGTRKSLCQVARPSLPRESYFYDLYNWKDHTCLIKKRFVQDTLIQDIEYITPGENEIINETFTFDKRDHAYRKVKSLKQPVGPSGEMHTTQTMMYFSGKYKNKDKLSHDDVYTLSFDAYHQKTEYRFDDYFRPSKIVKYQGEEIACIKEMSWSDKKEGSLLTQEGLRDEQGNLKLLTRFSYDNAGNVVSETLYGNLTGKNDGLVDFQKCEKEIKKQVRYEKIKTDKLAQKKIERTKRWDERKKEKLKLRGKKNPTHLNPTDHYSIKYTYTNDEYHLLTTKQLPSGLTYQYEYYPNTNLITKSFIIFKGNIQLREFYQYNEDLVLVQKISDDGCSEDPDNLSNVTNRRITKITPKLSAPALNFPETVEELYLDFSTNTYKSLTKTHFSYTNSCKVAKEERFDSAGKKAYIIENVYDSKDRLIQTNDPIGRVKHYKYNELSQLVFESSEETGSYKEFTKDVLGRLVFEKETFNSHLYTSKQHTYDLKNRLIKTQDDTKNLAEFCYDALGNITEQKLPKGVKNCPSSPVPIVRTKYDFAGRPIEEIDPSGGITKTSYNIRGDVTEVVFPDGSKESYDYNTDGSLHSHTFKNQSVEVYTYDFLKRVIKKSLFSSNMETLHEQHYKYKGPNLVEFIDVDGTKTQYRYDGAGRKIHEKKISGQKIYGEILYEYDALGRMFKTTHIGDDENTTQVHIQIFDLANRVIEERKESKSGKLFAKTTYSYDKRNNRVTTCVHNEGSLAITEQQFDAKNRITLLKNPRAETTHFEYQDYVKNPETNTYDYIKITTDPKGTRIHERFSSLDELISRSIVDSSGQKISEEQYEYNIHGSCIKQIHHVYENRNKVREVVHAWSFDSMGRPLRISEAFGDAHQKDTSITYFPDGQKKTLKTPNGIVQYFKYDPQSRLSEIKTSDNTIHYQFTYDKAGRIIQENDLISNTHTLKRYDEKGDLVHEELANGLKVEKEYDQLGRPVRLRLFDQSSIEKKYDAFHLISVMRKDSSNQFMYEHTYDEFNLEHQPLKQTAIYKLFEVTNHYDQKGLHVETASPHHFEKIEKFDLCGNVSAKVSSTHETNTITNYSYDELNHLVLEKGSVENTFSYDSLHNRTQKNHFSYELNALSQPTKAEDLDVTYDKNGNRIKTKSLEDEISYFYDAFDRLTAVQCKNKRTLYTYDASHRRLSKESQILTELGEWKQIRKENYLYDDLKEIAAVTPNFKILNLRVLGISKGGDIGGAVAIEIRSRIYAPLHDLQGNLTTLVDTQNKQVFKISYTVFGESSSYISPWGYQSKRFDPETGLIFFGRRHYDPRLGSWTTSDPSGLDEGPSLYQFLAGNPFIFSDIWGLTLFDPDKTSIHSKPTEENSWYESGNFYLLFGSPTGIPTYQNILYQVDAKHSDFYPINLENEGVSNACMFYVNGISTTKQECLRTSEAISSRLGLPGFAFHNKSHGPIDLVDVGAHHLGIKVHPTRELQRKLNTFCSKEQIESVYIFAHSEGAAILKNAIKNLPNIQKHKLHIYTFGAAEFIPVSYGRYVVNYVSAVDAVSLGNNLIQSAIKFEHVKHISKGGGFGMASYLIEKIIRSRTHSFNIKYLNPHSKNPLKEHAIMGTTYQKALQGACANIAIELSL